MKQPQDPAKTLSKITRIFRGRDKKKKEGTHTFTVTYDIYYNMLGAVIDIEETGECDKISLKTLRTVLKKLGKIRTLL